MKPAIIYGTESCHYCHVLEDFLSDNKIEFIKYDIVKEPVQRKKMIQLTGKMAVPVLSKGEKFVVGWDETKVRELLGL